MAKTLSATDFLGLADRRLTELVTVKTGTGEQSFWVRELSQADKQSLTGGGRNKSAKYHQKSGTIELDINAMDAARLMRYAVVTDETGKETVYDALVSSGMKGADVMDKFQNFPASIVEEISRVVSSLSGLSDTDDEIVEKKDNG